MKSLPVTITVDDSKGLDYTTIMLGYAQQFPPVPMISLTIKLILRVSICALTLSFSITITELLRLSISSTMNLLCHSVSHYS